VALPTPTQRGQIILLVDDNDAIRDLIRLALHGQGYRVETCADSREAVAIARQLPAPPDLLISDVELGELSGPDMAAQLRLEYPKLKILFMSGYPGADSSVVSGFNSAAATSDASFLGKPFSLHRLFQRVEEILAN
jgi:two-component system cell cycle sensor histidine kinase/response regulator CckA